MSSVVDTVSDFAGDVVDTVGDIGQSVIDAGSQVVDTVGTAVSDVAQTVSDAGVSIDKSVNDNIPGGWATVGAVALTIASAGSVNLEGETMAGEVAAGTVGSASGTGVGLTSGAVDAALVEGLSGSTQAALEAAGQGAVKGAAIGAAKSAITGGDPLQGALTGAVAGGLGGGFGNYASGLTEGTDLADYSKLVGSVAGGTAAGAGSAALNGRDPLTGALIGAIAGGTSNLASNIVPADVNPAITSGALGAAKAALTGGDPVTGALGAAGSSLVGQGVGAGYDAVKSGLDSVTPPTQTANITQDPNYKAAIEAGFNPDEAKALAQGASDPTLPAYAPTASNGTVTVTGINDVPEPLTPLVTPAANAPEAYPDKASPTGYSNNNGDPVNADGSTYTSPPDPLDLILYGDRTPNNTNPVTTAGNLPSTSNTSGSGTVADSTGLGNATTGAGAGSGEGTGAGTGGTGTGSGAGGIGLGLGALGIGTGSYKPTTNAPSNYAQDVTDGLTNLTPGLTKPMDYNLTGLSHFATGGSATSKSSSSLFDDKGNYNYGNLSDTPLTAALTKHNVSYTLTGLPSKAQGGLIENHNPQFYSEGGASMANRYVTGAGDGTSDSVPAMLANGEFVIPADIVSSLGNGSNDSGAKILDEFLRVIREHKKKHDVRRLPPNSKGPLSYLTDAKRKVKK